MKLNKVEKSVVSGKPSGGATRVISFTSGKGGVGKTSTVVNVALALAEAQNNVLLIDADLGLANIDVLLGVKPSYTLEDLFEGRRTLEEIMIPGPNGIRIIPAASGVESMVNLDSSRQMLLMQALSALPYTFDYVLIDTGAGIGIDVLYFNAAASEIVCIVTPEPTSLTDAYALIKVLSTQYGEEEINILVNNVSSEAESKQTFLRLYKAVERFLHVKLNYLGFVPADSSVREAVQSQRALLELFPSSPAGLAISALARRMDAQFHELRIKGGMQFFFEQLLESESR